MQDKTSAAGKPEFARISAKKSRGLTLVEIIVSTAVIIILASILIPKLAGYLSNARLEVCRTQVENIARLYKPIKESRDGKLSVDEYLAEFWSDGKEYTCPSGGEYVMSEDPDTGELRIYCMKHDESLSGIIPRTMYMYAIYLEACEQGTEALSEYKKQNGIGANEDITDAQFSRLMYKAGGNSWTKLNEETSALIIGGKQKPLYVHSCLCSGGNIVYYVNTSNARIDYSVRVFYDGITGRWYKYIGDEKNMPSVKRLTEAPDSGVWDKRSVAAYMKLNDTAVFVPLDFK